MISSRTWNTMMNLSATALLLVGAAALAQVPTGGSQQPMPAQQMGQPNSQSGSLKGVASSTAGSPIDQMFLRSVFDSDVAEVQLGQLAAQKSQSDDVKQFAQETVENRTKLSDQLKPIAAGLGVQAPKDTPKKTKQLVTRLQTLSGPEFDQEYIKAVVKDHRQEVKEFQSQVESCQDPTLGNAAEQDISVLAQHLQIAEQIAQAHNIALDTKK
jgi:putative membrane protein